jgi:hypothetical protein
MKRTGLTTWYWLATLALATLFWWAAPLGAQTQTPAAQNQAPPSQDDLTRRQLTSFDEFLDSHPELSAQIRNNPSLVNNTQFVADHPELQQYLQDHPEVRADLAQNPNAVTRQEEGYDRTQDRRDQDRNLSHAELVNMDRFMDSHPEIAEQLRKDPSLLDNQQFINSHPALKEFLAQHPGVREQARENPNFFMHAEERFDWREDHDITHSELANMDRFMESHPEIAQQIRKDPSVLDNKQFVDNHPALREFLAQHPGIRQEVRDNPNYFMHDEERFARRDDHWGHDDDATRGNLASFHGFLEDHSNVASELNKNPLLATNQEYLESHSELRNYLSANPQVNKQLNENPQEFVNSAESFDANSNGMTKGTMKLPADPKK